MRVRNALNGRSEINFVFAVRRNHSYSSSQFRPTIQCTLKTGFDKKNTTLGILNIEEPHTHAQTHTLYSTQRKKKKYLV